MGAMLETGEASRAAPADAAPAPVPSAQLKSNPKRPYVIHVRWRWGADWCSWRMCKDFKTAEVRDQVLVRLRAENPHRRYRAVDPGQNPGVD